jgi:hypothetical protein
LSWESQFPSLIHFRTGSQPGDRKLLLEFVYRHVAAYTPIGLE